MKRMKINKSRFTIFMLVVAIASLGAFGYVQAAEKNRYERHLDSYIKKNYQDLVGHVETLSNDLSKLMVSGNDKQNIMLLTKIWDESDAAGQSLSQIPVQNEQLRKTQKFINQLADYSYAMTQKSFQGNSLAALGEADLDLLRQLYEYSQELCEGLYNIDPDEVGVMAWKQAKNQRVRFADMQMEQDATEVFARTEQDDEGGQDGENQEGESINEGLENAGSKLSSASPFDSAMSKFEGRLIDYPKMIYDGPFSDHMEEGGLKKVEGKVVSEEEAKAAAAKFIDPTGGYPASNLTTLKGATGAAMSMSVSPESASLTYLFEYHMKKDTTCYISVTKKGGHIIAIMCSETSPRSNISRKQAEKIASAYLEERGIKDMELTYSQKDENSALMSYAAKKDNVLMYPDLIKVRISLTNGQIVGYDAANYLINHKERTTPTPKIKAEQAIENINQNGVVEGTKLCYIPNDFGGETYCYEIKVRSGNNYFLFYVNAMDAEIEDELRLLIDENGTLTA